LKKGANIPNIEVIVMAQAGKSVITVKQFLGRGLRTDGKNSELLVYDFYDEGNYVSTHSRQRIRMYRKEGFDVIEDYKTFRGKPVN
jgi:superfamily II DNA or RNA helicase